MPKGNSVRVACEDRAVVTMTHFEKLLATSTNSRQKIYENHPDPIILWRRTF